MMAFQALSSPLGVVIGYIITYIIKANIDVNKENKENKLIKNLKYKN
jgi:membrane protein YqaA with SNARE-associated domain